MQKPTIRSAEDVHITQQLHRLIDSGAEQAVINERIAALFEKAFGDTAALQSKTDQQEVRLSKLERYAYLIFGGAGLIVILWEVVRVVLPHVKP